VKFYFLHNHYIPNSLTSDGIFVKSVVVPEFYPDLNSSYLGEPCHFNSVQSYVKYVRANNCHPSDTIYAIENNRIIHPSQIKKTLRSYKQLGVKIIQLFCGTDNDYFTASQGVTVRGKELLQTLCDMDFILDLAHIPDKHIVSIAENYEGQIIVSHCACSDLYLSNNLRSNSLTKQNIARLANRVRLFGVSFLNDIISSNENELDQGHILDDILAQVVLLVKTVGSDKVAFGPDFLDVGYFSRKFKTDLLFPDTLLTKEGLMSFANRMGALLSSKEIERITSTNVERILFSSSYNSPIHK